MFLMFLYRFYFMSIMCEHLFELFISQGYNRSADLESLQSMFPNIEKATLESEMKKHTSIDDVIDVFLKGGKEEVDDEDIKLPTSKKTKIEFENMADMICEYRTLVNHNSSTSITVDRDEVWRSALTFYKRSTTEKLFKDFVVNFSKV